MVAFIIVFSFPSVPCFASDLPFNGFVTYESIQGYDWGYDLDSWNGGVEGSGAKLSAFFNPDAIFYVTNEQISTTGIFNHLNDLPVDLNGRTFIVSCNGLNSSGTSGNIDLFVFPDGYDYVACCSDGGDYGTEPASSRVQFGFACKASQSLNVEYYSYNASNKTWFTNNNRQGSYSSSLGICTFSSLGKPFIMSSDFYCYSKDYKNWLDSYKNGDTWVSPHYTNNEFFDAILNRDYDGLKWNYSQLPFYNGSEIIVPDTSVVESNDNHLTLSNFNIQFCKPFDLNDIYSRAGGGYAAFTYDFDSWVNAHSSDYELNIITQIDVDGQSYTYPNVSSLDVSGVLVLPFSGLAPSYQWSNENLLFVEYPNKLFGNYKLGYIYSLTYQNYVSNAQRFLGSGRSNRLFFKGHNLQQDFDDIVSSQIEQLFTNVTHSNFKISFTVTMVDTVSGERSGSFVKTFDLLNGVYNVTSNTIQDNQNPFEYSDESPFLPIEDSGGGYGLSTNNQNQLVNFQFPSDIELFIDNGFKQFLAWYETSGDTAYVTNRFWSSMGIFEENPAIPLYRTYFGFLPEDFKAIIFGCAGIGIIGGAFCILRRRLH